MVSYMTSNKSLLIAEYNSVPEFIKHGALFEIVERDSEYLDDNYVWRIMGLYEGVLADVRLIRIQSHDAFRTHKTFKDIYDEHMAVGNRVFIVGEVLTGLLKWNL